MADSLQDKLRDIVKRWLTAGQSDGIYGEYTPGAEVGIDKGGYGDPHEDTRPEFVKKDTDGWESIVILRR